MVGVDRVVAEAGVAKTTLYRHFASKEALVVAALHRHEELWTLGWLEPETARRANSPAEQLVAVFDALADWIKQPTYAGCFFTNSVLEIHDRSSKIRAAAVNGIERVHDFLLRLGRDAGAHDPDGLAHQVQLLMRGVFVAGVEARFEAVQMAGVAARRLLQHEIRD